MRPAQTAPTIEPVEPPRRPAPRVMSAVIESDVPPMPPAEETAQHEPQRSQPFYKPSGRSFASDAGLDFDANDEGYTPNFGRLKDDLDVPAFLRKQMD